METDITVDAFTPRLLHDDNRTCNFNERRFIDVECITRLMCRTFFYKRTDATTNDPFCFELMCQRTLRRQTYHVIVPVG